MLLYHERYSLEEKQFYMIMSLKVKICISLSNLNLKYRIFGLENFGLEDFVIKYPKYGSIT